MSEGLGTRLHTSLLFPTQQLQVQHSQYDEYNWASVSITRISNNTSVCCYHTALTSRSTPRAGISLASSASLTTGSLTTSLYANAAMSPRASLTSLCRWATLLAIQGMHKIKGGPTAITVGRHPQKRPAIECNHLHTEWLNIKKLTYPLISTYISLKQLKSCLRLVVNVRYFTERDSE